MRFVNPSLFLWALLLLVPVILYLFRRRPVKVRVSTLLFFKSLAREHRESAWLRRLKRLLSFLLTILVMSASVGALVKVVVAPPAEAVKSVVILVDASASMASRDADGGTCMEKALVLIERRLAGLPDGITCSVMTHTNDADVLLTRSIDRREVNRALSSITVRPVEGDAEAALNLAWKLASLETPAAIWYATEGGDVRGDIAEKDADRISFVPLYVHLSEPVNAGITALSLRRKPLEHARYEGFVEIATQAPGPVEAKLDVSIDGTLLEVRSLALSPGASQRLLIPLDAGAGSILSLHLKTENDVLDLDNVVHARIPPFKPVNVCWVSASPVDPYTQLALLALVEHGEVEVFPVEPESYPAEGRFDVLIFSSWLPEKWPRDVPVVVIDPPGSAGPVRAVRIQGEGLPVERLRVAEEHHPLLYGVASSRIKLTQTCVLDTGEVLDPLWMGSSGPILSAGEVASQKVTVMGFQSERSSRFPLMASYPILIGNAVFWSVQSDDEKAGNNYTTGQVMPLEDETITFWTPDAEGGRKDEKTLKVRGNWYAIERLGLWETGDGTQGSASLLSRGETLLATAEDVEDEAAEAKDAAVEEGGLFTGDLTMLFLFLVVVVLLLENWLYHRRGVY